jgi:hypothetical protein
MKVRTATCAGARAATGAAPASGGGRTRIASGLFSMRQSLGDDLRVLRNIHQSLKENVSSLWKCWGKERLARVWKDTMCNELADGSLIFQRPQIRDDWPRIRSEWTLVKEAARAASSLSTRSILAGS